MTQLLINGVFLEVSADGETPLLWVIRDHLGLTGTKFGCGIGLCGSCTIHIDGRAVRSCTLALSAVESEARITTIEGLSADGEHPVQRAWIREQVPQCGYCQPGMIMAVAALLEETPNPSDEQIQSAITNLCRCGTYARVRRAIARAAEAGSE